LSAAASLQAYPRMSTIVDDIRQADLIVFGDVSQEDDFSFRKKADAEFVFTIDYTRNFTIKPLEILKGDASLLGETINLQEDGFISVCGGPNLEVGQQIVLLVKDAEKGWTALEGYSREYIPRVRCLIDILRVNPEAARIQKFIDLIQNTKDVCPQADWNDAGLAAQFRSALYAIHDKDSFSVVEKALPNARPEFQALILRWMSETGDLRAVPSLSRYIDSQDHDVWYEARTSLISYFPGAPGVTEAFLEKWKTTPDIAHGSILDYLYKRVSDPEVDKAYLERFEAEPSFYVKAATAFRDGPAADAKKYCIQVIEDALINDSSLTSLLADCVATALSPAEQNKYIPLIAGYLEKQIENNDSGYAGKNALRAALSVKHPALIRALILSLKKQNKIFDTFDQDKQLSVVSAIRAYGKDASDMAVKEIFSQIDEALRERHFSMENFWPIIALVWLGTEQDISAMRQILEDNRAGEEYEQLAASLKPISKIPDETAFWIEMIKNGSKFPSESVKWFAARLGQLQDKRAIPTLMGILEEKTPVDEQPVYRALAKIGKPGIEQLKSFSLKLDVHSTSSRHRDIIDVLCESEKENLLPFLRQLVKNNSSVGSSQPWMCIEQYGSVEDIALLTPYTDYWKYGPGRLYWPRSALAQLRQKYGYDITGPIRKK